MAPAQQFVPNLHKDGSIDTLADLLTSLANRLQWRSNQADLLFPPVASAPEVNTATDDSESDDSTRDISDAAATDAAVAAAKAFSDDEQDAVLSLPDEILARAVLCPPGVVVALAKTARRDDRKKTTGDGGGGGGHDDDRWHREVRALAEGRGSSVTVGEGAAAVDRVLREIKAWETRGRGKRYVFRVVERGQELAGPNAPGELGTYSERRPRLLTGVKLDHSAGLRL